MADALKAAYDPQEFRTLGHELIDLIADYLNDVHEENISVNRWETPDEQLRFWKNYPLNDSPVKLFKTILERSMHVHHPRYMGHQVSPTAPAAALAALLSALLNNGMAVYEMGAAATAIEHIITHILIDKIGFSSDCADGFVTSGGTLANLTALLAARNVQLTKTQKDKKYSNIGIIVSSEAHYCIERAIRVMGLGDRGLVSIAVDENYRMKTTSLETVYQEATARGIHIIAVVGSAPSTSTGVYDDLNAIADFCEKKQLWFHIDGAHGGAAVFSKKYKSLLNGIQRADSVVIDGHKMLMTPALMTFLLFKEKKYSTATFRQKAHYLWQKSEEEWYNTAKRTFECTKHMMSITFYTLLNVYGEQVFDDFVTTLYDTGFLFAEKIRQRPCFELAVAPHSNIVCFRYLPPGLTESEYHTLNTTLRARILEEGKFYIVQTQLHGVTYLRTTFMSPNTTPEILDELLDEIESLGKIVIRNLS